MDVTEYMRRGDGTRALGVLRFGAVIESSAMRVRDVRPWLLKHGYMTQQELDACERGAK